MNGCKSERKYVYPHKDTIEIQRICLFIKARETNRFMVLLGKIYPLNNDGVSVYLKNISTSLEDGGYFCGKSHFKNFYCNEKVTEKIYNANCNF
tara:strand:- start:49 stop:330 length:282 start_codon:yes stop_codon:yes gene_type:complete